MTGWLPAELDAAANYLFDPGISVLKPALLAAQAGLVTAMHDPTEGGLATGIAELALAAGVGMEIDLDRVPVSDLSRRLCAAFEPGSAWRPRLRRAAGDGRAATCRRAAAIVG
jgi:hydrogenase expression/formation protein HypE